MKTALGKLSPTDQVYNALCSGDDKGLPISAKCGVMGAISLWRGEFSIVEEDAFLKSLTPEYYEKLIGVIRGAITAQPKNCSRVLEKWMHDIEEYEQGENHADD